MDYCKNCSNFVKRSGNKYCSKECAFEFRKKSRVKKVCLFCGKSTYRCKSCSDRKYCNIHCCTAHSRQAASNLKVKVCPDCGKEKSIDEFPLKRQDSIYHSSYCFECRKERQLNKSHTIHDRWVRSKRAAIRKKGVGWWTINENEFASLISEKCHYCGGDLGISGSALDRKCNDVGYGYDNVVPCCKKCNIIKNDHFSYEEMMLLSPILKQIRENR